MRYLSTIVAAGLVLGTAQVASAADMARPVYKAAPPVVMAYNWSGFYAGIHGGYGWGELGSNIFSGNAKQDGWFGGGQIGWNWQGAGSPWVFGVEVDSAFANIKDDVSVNVGGGVVANAFSEMDYFGTARLRVGYAVDRVLWYATGGLAWGHNEIGASVAGPGFAAGATSANTHIGYAVGGGLEWALVDNWTAKVEYLYLDFGSENYFGGPAAGGFDADLSAHTVKVGLNYRFGYGKGPVVARY